MTPSVNECESKCVKDWKYHSGHIPVLSRSLTHAHTHTHTSTVIIHDYDCEWMVVNRRWMNGLNDIGSFSGSMRTTYLMSQDNLRMIMGSLATAGLDLVSRQTLIHSNAECLNALVWSINPTLLIGCIYQHFRIFLCVLKRKSRSEQPHCLPLRSFTVYAIEFMTFDHELWAVVQLLVFFFLTGLFFNSYCIYTKETSVQFTAKGCSLFFCWLLRRHPARYKSYKRGQATSAVASCDAKEFETVCWGLCPLTTIITHQLKVFLVY